MVTEVETLVARAREFARRQRRTILGIVGPPGGGKSTLAQTVVTVVGSAAVLVPMDGFLTTMSADAGTRAVRSQATRCARAGVRSLTTSTSSEPRAGSRLTTVIDAAPASAGSTAIARAAPPAPNSTSEVPAGSTTVRSPLTNPCPSVFSPT